MTSTPLERFIASVYRGGMVAVGVAIGGLLLYVAVGGVMLSMGTIELSYPFLDVAGDPVLLFLLAGAGLFVTIGMIGYVFHALLSPGREEEVLVVVLLSSIAIGFGLATFYYSFRLLTRIVGG